MIFFGIFPKKFIFLFCFYKKQKIENFFLNFFCIFGWKKSIYNQNFDQIFFRVEKKIGNLWGGLGVLGRSWALGAVNFRKKNPIYLKKNRNDY